jgi:hypothetical protein
MTSIRDDEVIRQKYSDMYSTDIDIVRRHIDSSTKFKDLIAPDFIVDVNQYVDKTDFVEYMNMLPNDQLLMVLRYQNIIQNHKYIKKYLGRMNHDIPEMLKLMNWLSMNHIGYNKIFHPVEEEEFDEEEYIKENM